MKLLLESVLKSKVTSKLIHSFANSLMDLIPISKPSKSLVPFITALINESQVSSVVVYLAKIYLDRLKPLLISCTGLPSTWHRLALSVLIIAEKSICDVPMRNKYWQEHAKLFSLEEVNLMERQLLSLMVNFCNV